jgi:hypothetical protein
MTLTRLATVAQHLLTAAPAPEQQQVPRAKDPVRPKRAAGTAGEETPTILPELERWRADLPALKEQFNRDGFVLVSGLIPEAVISAAEDVVYTITMRVTIALVDIFIIYSPRGSTFAYTQTSCSHIPVISKRPACTFPGLIERPCKQRVCVAPG